MLYYHDLCVCGYHIRAIIHLTFLFSQYCFRAWSISLSSRDSWASWRRSVPDLGIKKQNNNKKTCMAGRRAALLFLCTHQMNWCMTPVHTGHKGLYGCVWLCQRVSSCVWQWAVGQHHCPGRGHFDEWPVYGPVKPCASVGKSPRPSWLLSLWPYWWSIKLIGCGKYGYR